MIIFPRRVHTMTGRTKIVMGLTLACFLSLTVLLIWSMNASHKPGWEPIVFAMVCTIISAIGLFVSLHADSVNRTTGIWAKRILASIEHQQPMDTTNVRYLSNQIRR